MDGLTPLQIFPSLPLRLPPPCGRPDPGVALLVLDLALESWLTRAGGGEHRAVPGGCREPQTPLAGSWARIEGEASAHSLCPIPRALGMLRAAQPL